MENQTPLPECTVKEMASLKSYFPYRIVYGVVHPETKETFAGAVYDMRQPNKFARAGYVVYTLGKA